MTTDTDSMSRGEALIEQVLTTIYGTQQNYPVVSNRAHAKALIAPLFAALSPIPQSEAGEREQRFWLSLREPGRIPERKGPWPLTQTAKVLREFIAARPTAYIDYITLDCFGHPQIEHGPEVLQIADGRSMRTGSKHNRRVREAEAEAALSTPPKDSEATNGGVAEADIKALERMVEHRRGLDLLIDHRPHETTELLSRILTALGAKP